jgi:lipoprotein-releasing system permease protein
MNSLAFRIARRYLFSKKSTNVINIISGLSMVAMGFGACFLLIFFSVFNGFESLVASLYNSFYSDLEIRVEEGRTFSIDSVNVAEIKNLEDVVVVSFCLEQSAHVMYNGREYIATIKGVDSNYHKVNQLDEFILQGDYALFEKRSYLNSESGSYETVAEPQAIVGATIYTELNLSVANQLEKMLLSVPKTGAGTSMDKFRRMSIQPRAVFGIQKDFDEKYVIVPIEFAEDLFKQSGRVSQIEIALRPNADLVSLKSEVAEIIGPSFRVRDRFEQEEVLYRVMKMERWAMFAILAFILLVISFNIVGALSMLVMEKKKDIYILSAMGATRSLIRRIFLLEGAMISAFGGFVGLILGTLICFGQMKFGIVKLQGAGSFVTDSYPVVLHLGDFLLISAMIISIALLASWFPARQASNI